MPTQVQVSKPGQVCSVPEVRKRRPSGTFRISELPFGLKNSNRERVCARLRLCVKATRLSNRPAIINTLKLETAALVNFRLDAGAPYGHLRNIYEILARYVTITPFGVTASQQTFTRRGYRIL